jgi:hypothetical protein
VPSQPLGAILNTTLANNGGSTRTHALVTGSPSIDAINDGTCPPPAKDQRGVMRPQDGNGDGGPVCDIGSYEFVFTGTAPVQAPQQPVTQQPVAPAPTQPMAPEPNPTPPPGAAPPPAPPPPASTPSDQAITEPAPSAPTPTSPPTQPAPSPAPTEPAPETPAQPEPVYPYYRRAPAWQEHDAVHVWIRRVGPNSLVAGHFHLPLVRCGSLDALEFFQD